MAFGSNYIKSLPSNVFTAPIASAFFTNHRILTFRALHFRQIGVRDVILEALTIRKGLGFFSGAIFSGYSMYKQDVKCLFKMQFYRLFPEAPRFLDSRS